MKVLIEIPEDIYENRDDEDYIKMCAEEISTAFRNSITIPDNATNGDMIKALFHNINYEEGYVYVKSNTHKNVIMTVREDWWNSLYQKGGKDEVN